MNASNAPLTPASLTFNDETLAADAFPSTLHRVSDEYLNGWHVCYRNNDDRVTAWRAEGGSMTEAEGYVDTNGYPKGANCFHAQSMRVVAGAVTAWGDRTFRPGPWSRRVSGKIRYQYTIAGAAQLEADGFQIESSEITPEG